MISKKIMGKKDDSVLLVMVETIYENCQNPLISKESPISQSIIHGVSPSYLNCYLPPGTKNILKYWCNRHTF